MFRYRCPTGLAVTALLVSLATSVHAELRYRVQELSYAGNYSDYEYFTAHALNNRGVVVGSYQQVEEIEWVKYPFDTAYISRGSRLEPLPGTGAFHESSAVGINDRGQVIGEYRRPEDAAQVPYLYTEGQYRDLRVENKSNWDYARGINASGQVVGRADGKAFFFDGTRSRYIDIPGAVASHAEALNDRGTVLGSAFFNTPGSGLEERTFVYDDSQGVRFLENPIPGYGNAAPVEINNTGQMAAYVWQRDKSVYRSFIYEADGRFTDMGTLDQGTGSTSVAAINNKGWAVGISSTGTCNMLSCSDGYLWRDGRMVSLSELVGPSQANDWYFTSVVDINDRGQILGNGWHYGSTYTPFLLTPVPEPGNWALLLAGLGVVGAAARRRCGT